ncbi:MAG: acyltransferase [Mesorhizobium sp.]|uniref:acyltransferase family protein n=1 Tax=Mesorhizobium sp. TaxID=1871066 RepID=UPI001AC8E083|nr:acyltransferase [Mesorhizobium sp.]MBN9222956.1 acyltransferase [Mesorhizobium sp.]
MAEIHSIQYLRGLAAVAVVCFHVNQQFGGPFDVGAAGVDLFFVISGFIMWVTTSGRSTQPWRFISRRVTRIVPLYWIVTLLTASAIFLKPCFFYDHMLSPLNFFGSLVFVPVLEKGLPHPVLPQGWTLSYEMMFYLIFALTLFLGERRRFGMVVGLLVGISLLHFFLPMGYARALTRSLVLEFAAGIIIGRLWTEGIRLPMAAALTLACCGFLLLAGSELLGWEAPRVLRWGVPAALIVAGAVFAERASPFRPVRLFTFLGEASYSIYLWHLLTAVTATSLALLFGVPAGLQPALIIIVSLAAPALLYLAVEKPLLRLLHPSPETERKRAAPSAPSRAEGLRRSLAAWREGTRPRQGARAALLPAGVSVA